MYKELIMTRNRDGFWADIMHRSYPFPQNNLITQVAIDYIFNMYSPGLGECKVEVSEGDRELYLISEQQLPCANCGN